MPAGLFLELSTCFFFTESIHCPEPIVTSFTIPIVPFCVRHDVGAVFFPKEPTTVVWLPEVPVQESWPPKGRLIDPLTLPPSVRQTQPELFPLPGIPSPFAELIFDGTSGTGGRVIFFVSCVNFLETKQNAI